MPLVRFARRSRPPADALSDAQLLESFGAEPERAWELFIDRYADFIFSCLRRLGFDHDEAMDRFVFVCEKLCEQDFRRLRSIRFVGRDGELVPWIRTVVRNLSISWAWSVDGRKRLFKSIEALDEPAQRIFELYFWQGLSASQIAEQLRAETQAELGLGEVLDGLERVFTQLSDHQRWRVTSQLARRRPTTPIEVRDPETGVAFEPAAETVDPETALLEKERSEILAQELQGLEARDRLILQLRYEEALGLAEVAQIVGLSLSTVKSSLKASQDALRGSLGRRTSERGIDALS